MIIVEVTANNVNKATAINSILDEWKLDKNEIIAFGDSNNDLEMLDYVGVGVAMGNASDNVKIKVITLLLIMILMEYITL